jgi:hypothetical protein
MTLSRGDLHLAIATATSAALPALAPITRSRSAPLLTLHLPLFTAWPLDSPVRTIPSTLDAIHTTLTAPLLRGFTLICAALNSHAPAVVAPVTSSVAPVRLPAVAPLRALSNQGRLR